MSTHDQGAHGRGADRRVELAVDRATIGLGPDEALELNASLAGDPAFDADVYEYAASALHVAVLQASAAGSAMNDQGSDPQAGSLEGPPEGLVRRLEAQALAHLDLNEPPAPLRPRRSNAWVGWFAAAALALAWFVVERPDTGPSFEDLLARADTIQADWVPGEDELSAGVAGKVIWNGAEQAGYMRFRDLATNDPSEKRYQLWIFDQSRPDWQNKPVDGGLFDVSPGAEATVPIEAKLAIDAPVLFAVTLEEPAGVVVSEREHLIVTAPVK